VPQDETPPDLDHDLRVRQEILRRYGVGPEVEGAVNRALELRPGQALLDLGTGRGDYPGRLREAGHHGRLVGLDVSAPLLKRAGAAHPDVEFVEADAGRLPFPDGSFEAVTARQVLFHLPDISAALAEAHRVLVPGGRFLALTNASGHLAEFWRAVAGAALGDPELVPLWDTPGSPRFPELELEQLVGEAFGGARLGYVEGAVEFADPVPALAFFDAYRSSFGLPPAAWARAGERLRRGLEERLTSGPWRVSSRVAIIAARRV
jgi:SAM-dependent methyltransferase